jgi:1-acyl-sn-glycerol-3-phosphate acyltransferase
MVPFSTEESQPTDQRAGEKPLQGDIPFPQMRSWMHDRIPVPKMTRADRLKRFKNHPREYQFLESMLSQALRFSKFMHPEHIWTFYRIWMTILRWGYKWVYRMEVHGQENIPKQGAIFLINHPDGLDVVLPFNAAFRKPVGVFTDMGDNLLVDIAELLGIVPRRGVAEIMVERMVRQIACKNRYFAMWPEGTPDKGQGVMNGFSSIARVYATLNWDRNRIPFVPVVMQTVRKKMKPPTTLKEWRRYKRTGAKKVVFTYLSPEYVPREWLKRPEEGGKSPREIIDFYMLKIARKMGQKTLAPNPVLEYRKREPHYPWHNGEHHFHYRRKKSTLIKKTSALK